MSETTAKHIDDILADLIESAVADAQLGACESCTHRSCARKREVAVATRACGDELAAYLATLRAQLAGVREKVEKALDAAARRGEEYSYDRESSFLGPNVRGRIYSRRGDLYDMKRDVLAALDGAA